MGAVIGGWERMLHVTQPKPFGAEYHRARRAGVPPRVPKMTGVQRLKVRDMYISGMYTLKEIAQTVGFHTSSVHKMVHTKGWRRSNRGERLVRARLSKLNRDRHGKIMA